MTGPFDLRAWREDRVARFDAWLDAALPADGVWPESFHTAMRYPLFGGGKRVRPLLVCAAYEALAADPTDLAAAWPAAGALELVHTYSLVHDDLPCMDDDDERRGRPTVHRAFDEATAVLVGDALLTHAFSVLAAAPWPPGAVVAAVAELSRSAGHQGMVGGQVADVAVAGADTSLPSLTRIHAGKTGALMRASCVLGGIAAGARPDRLEALAAYGMAIGMAFQLADDVLDAEADQREGGPPSFVKLLGVDETRARADEASARAQAAVASFPRPAALNALARYVVERTH